MGFLDFAHYVCFARNDGHVREERENGSGKATPIFSFFFPFVPVMSSEAKPSRGIPLLYRYGLFSTLQLKN